MIVINVFQPSLGLEELDAISEVFKSNWLGKGSKTNQFEQAFAHHLHVPPERIISTNCCTEGMFHAIEILGIGPGDEVILPTISFVGAGNAIAASGAKPVFCDVDPRTLNATAHTIEKEITPRTKAAILIHYGGYPCDVDGIVELLRNHGIFLIEDSACSVASQKAGRACGTFGDIGVWSFDAMKILVTGDGGMIYVKNPDLRMKFEQNTYLGLMNKSGINNTVDSKWWEFDISSFGRRSIMNDISSTIGLVQLKRLDSFIAARKKVHEKYNEMLSGLDWLVLPPQLENGSLSSYYFYWIQLSSTEIRDRLASYLRDHDIYTTFRYFPLHLVKRYGSTVSLPYAESAANHTLCLPIHQSLSDDDIQTIVSRIKAFSESKP